LSIKHAKQWLIQTTSTKQYLRCRDHTDANTIHAAAPAADEITWLATTTDHKDSFTLGVVQCHVLPCGTAT